MRIFLIGFMGSGKTTIGKQLAERLGYNFIDMDDYIVEKEKRTINKIFEQDGEPGFREIEKKTLHEMFQLDNIIIGAGGGTPCFFDNMEQMNKHGKTFYLEMDTGGLVERLLHATSERPLIKDKSPRELYDFVKEKLEDRNPFYKKAIHIIPAKMMKVEDFMPYL